MRLWSFALLAGPGLLFAAPNLILHNFFVGPTPTPTYIRGNNIHLATLPFDGISVYIRTPDLAVNVTADVYRPSPMSYATIADALAPLHGVPLGRLRYNFALMFAGPGIDLFDDAAWYTRLCNMTVFARALREIGLKGIFFDNENYEDWAYYGGKGCSSSRSRASCQAQARRRGYQVMRALMSEYPEITVLLLYGPWVSDNTFYERQSAYNNVAHANELSGPFFVGMVQAANGSGAKIVDGGELYLSRTPADFDAMYRYQKYGIAHDGDVPTDSRSRASGPNGFIPSALRPHWAAAVSAGAGIYDRAQTDATGRHVNMNPDILRTTIGNALARVDDYVWFYPETMTFLQPPGTNSLAAPVRWVQAVRDATASATAPR